MTCAKSEERVSRSKRRAYARLHLVRDLAAFRRGGRARIIEWLALAFIVVVAGVFRLHSLHWLPPGLHFDEAANALDALDIVQTGRIPVFLERNYGREPLFVWLVVASFRFLGPSPYAIRLVAALIGTITVVAMFLMAKGLFSHRANGVNGVGLLSAALTGVLYWHVNFSRLGLCAVLLPLFEALTIWFLWYGISRGSRWRYIAGGICLAGCLYTYLSGWLFPLVIVFMLTSRAFQERRELRQHLINWALVASGFLLVASPLAMYFAQHPESFLRRAGQVSPLATKEREGSVISYVATNAVKTLGMFAVKGDNNQRSNLPGRPVFDRLAFVAFLAGIAYSMWQVCKPECALLLFWLVLMLLPTVFSEYAPHFIRSIGALPAAVVLVAVGLNGLVDLGWRWAGLLPGSLRRAGRVGLMVLLAMGLYRSARSTWHDYFERWGRDPGLFYAFDQDLLEMGLNLSRLAEGTHLYVSPHSRNHPTLQFSMGDRWPPASYNGRHCQAFPPADGRPAAYGIFLLGGDQFSLGRLQEAFPSGNTVLEKIDPLGNTSYVIYAVPSDAKLRLESEHGVNYQVGEGFLLVGYDLSPTQVRPGETITLTLYWKVREATNADYTVFTHLIHSEQVTGDVTIWGQLDSQPCNRDYPTSVWQVGEYILDRYPIVVSENAPPGVYQVEVGMYNLATMVRLPVWGPEGGPEDRILLGEVVVLPPV